MLHGESERSKFVRVVASLPEFNTFLLFYSGGNPREKIADLSVNSVELGSSTAMAERNNPDNSMLS